MQAPKLYVEDHYLDQPHRRARYPEHQQNCQEQRTRVSRPDGIHAGDLFQQLPDWNGVLAEVGPELGELEGTELRVFEDLLSFSGQVCITGEVASTCDLDARTGLCEQDGKLLLTTSMKVGKQVE